MRARSFLLFGVVATAAVGCSRYDSLAVGQALTVADADRKAAPAAILEVATGTGTSGVTHSNFGEARARALIGAEHQQIAGLTGLSHVAWLSPHSSLWTSGNLGLGVEHSRGIVFIEPIFQARFGTGFVIRNRVQYLRPHWLRNPWEDAERFRPEADRIMLPGEIVQTRKLLTLSMTADADLRFTRDPLYVVALMIGLTDVVERRMADR